MDMYYEIKKNKVESNRIFDLYKNGAEQPEFFHHFIKAWSRYENESSALSSIGPYT